MKEFALLFFFVFAKLCMAQNVDIKILKEGSGEPVKKRQLVQVHYSGWLLDNTKFDSSRDRGEPLEFVLGAGQVIKGWDIGIEGMKHGEVRRLNIPAALAYGKEAIGPIPANSDLLFEVELVGAQKILEPDSLLKPSMIKWKTLQPGLEIFDEKTGNGTELHTGMELAFHYTGWLVNGHKFGSSKDFGKPAKVILGMGKLVKGLEIGLESIKQGGVRWFRLSPSMAYGPVAMTEIPPNSALVFRVQADSVHFDAALAASMDFFPNTNAVKWIDGQEGLKYYIEKVGSGEPAKLGSIVKVHYTGWLSDGTKFDSSRDRGEPISLELGAGRVIRGWDLGLAGMKPGEKRLLLIPPSLGYGSRGGGPIPPNAILIFAVELEN
ncbi:MAG: FKBP-type peptidyl-prolyl cis-trans isomerase [Fibromonadaceae bacterium]|jgi:peptidylprolyl isomerase|nr:FKBP-type peptidyl-prolyl cis-trans isomerase [Fibromonadaceae bacterium]